MKRAFSLIELLVALGILALVAAVVAPRFLNLQDHAKDAVAQQMAAQLNRTYAEWVASGGVIGSNAATSDLLYALASPGAARNVDRAGTSGDITNGGSSDTVRLSLSAETLAALPPPTATAQQVVAIGETLVYFDNASQTFVTGKPAVADQDGLYTGKSGQRYGTMSFSITAPIVCPEAGNSDTYTSYGYRDGFFYPTKQATYAETVSPGDWYTSCGPGGYSIGTRLYNVLNNSLYPVISGEPEEGEGSPVTI